MNLLAKSPITADKIASIFEQLEIESLRLKEDTVVQGRNYSDAEIGFILVCDVLNYRNYKIIGRSWDKMQTNGLGMRS